MGMTSGKAQTASGRTAMYRLGSSERADLPLGVAIGAGTMGMAAARRMAQRYRVLIADIDGARAEAGAAALRGEGGDARGLACDVTDPAAVAVLAARVAELGGLGGLAHVAGLSPSLGDYATILRVNLTGVALVAGALLPHARPGSAAVLIASLAAHNFRPSDAAIEVLRDPAAPDLPDRLAAVIGPENATPPMAYVYSKWGILAYARRQAAAWGAKGARIVSLSPGLIATSQGALEFEKSPGKRAMYERTPLAREGTMLEIADAIEFLLSERASFISGTDLLVDGGLAGTLGGD
jgi:NAD(P)-dependent dehydrogenase (short-subunit alcohol dehydrogenase family)